MQAQSDALQAGVVVEFERLERLELVAPTLARTNLSQFTRLFYEPSWTGGGLP